MSIGNYTPHNTHSSLTTQHNTQIHKYKDIRYTNTHIYSNHNSYYTRVHSHSSTLPTWRVAPMELTISSLADSRPPKQTQTFDTRCRGNLLTDIRCRRMRFKRKSTKDHASPRAPWGTCTNSFLMGTHGSFLRGTEGSRSRRMGGGHPG